MTVITRHTCSSNNDRATLKGTPTTSLPPPLMFPQRTPLLVKGHETWAFKCRGRCKVLMNGTKAVHPGVTTALFSSCNSPGGRGGGVGGVDGVGEGRLQRNRRHRVPCNFTSKPQNLKFLHLIPPPSALRACHSAPLHLKLLCIAMWGCCVKMAVDPPPECCGISPLSTSVAGSCGVSPVHTVFEAEIRTKKKTTILL